MVSFSRDAGLSRLPALPIPALPQTSVLDPDTRTGFRALYVLHPAYILVLPFAFVPFAKAILFPLVPLPPLPLRSPYMPLRAWGYRSGLSGHMSAVSRTEATKRACT